MDILYAQTLFTVLVELNVYNFGTVLVLQPSPRMAIGSSEVLK